MKRYWMTLGIILTITAILVGVGEIVRINRKEVLSDEVLEQLPEIADSFDTEALDELYNSREEVEVRRSEIN